MGRRCWRTGVPLRSNEVRGAGMVRAAWANGSRASRCRLISWGALVGQHGQRREALSAFVRRVCWRQEQEGRAVNAAKQRSPSCSLEARCPLSGGRGPLSGREWVLTGRGEDWMLEFHHLHRSPAHGTRCSPQPEGKWGPAEPVAVCSSYCSQPPRK